MIRVAVDKLHSSKISVERLGLHDGPSKEAELVGKMQVGRGAVCTNSHPPTKE